MYKSQLVTWCC